MSFQEGQSRMPTNLELVFALRSRLDRRKKSREAMTTLSFGAAHIQAVRHGLELNGTIFFCGAVLSCQSSPLTLAGTENLGLRMLINTTLSHFP